MTTDTDIIDQVTRIMYDTLSGQYGDFGMPTDAGQALADAGLLRESDRQRNERMAADAKVYATLTAAVTERDKAQAERNMAVGRVDEMRQRLAQARSECVAEARKHRTLAAKIAQLRVLHRRELDDDGPYCRQCCEPFPCPTVRILDGEAQS